MKGICIEDGRNSEETPCTENLMILRNFQYWHKFFVLFVLLLSKDVFEGFGHRPLKLNHLKRNSQYLNLGLFEAIGIRDKQARDDSTIVPLGHRAVGPGPLIGKTLQNVSQNSIWF